MSKGKGKGKGDDVDGDEDVEDAENQKKKKKDDADDPSAPALPGYIGVGMLGGIVLGFDPLRDAAQGNGAFEDAMIRFVACLLVCVAAASVIGRLLDSAPPEEVDAEQETEVADPSAQAGSPEAGDGAGSDGPANIDLADGASRETPSESASN